MKRKVFAVVLVLMLSAGLFSCAKKEEGPEPEDIADSVIAACDEISIELVPAVQDALVDFVEDKEEKAEKEPR